MVRIVHILLFICLVLKGSLLFSQQKIDDKLIKIKNKITTAPLYNPLAPAKAAFYSTILPGAGQIYNKRYIWQLPAIYGGLALSTYLYVSNNNQYYTYRDAYNKRKLGLPDPFDGKNGRKNIPNSYLEIAQKQLRKNREFSMICIVLTYALQIVEASVTAHLLQFDDSDSLTIQPTTIQKEANYFYNEDITVAEQKIGLSLKYSF